MITIVDYLHQMRADERHAIRHAIAEVRGEHLMVFEAYRKAMGTDADLSARAVIETTIKRLRRQLGLRAEPDRDLVRMQTRERVRRLRERRKTQ